MKRLLVGGIAALAVALGITAPAGADPVTCSPEPVCHEFDWARPYYKAFERHGIGYVGAREGIPLMEAVDAMCRGQKSDFWNYVTLTTAEYGWVVEAASDVCPEVLR
jgi:hypothetical protein